MVWLSTLALIDVDVQEGSLALFYPYCVSKWLVALGFELLDVECRLCCCSILSFCWSTMCGSVPREEQYVSQPISFEMFQPI